MRSRRALGAVAIFAAVLLQVTGASAAAPSNDVIGGATTVGATPFTDTVDTSEATTDADDAALNELCGAPATDASVWYKLEGTGGDLLIDVSSSTYSAGVLVGAGSPGALELVTCGPGAVALFAEAGITYYILAIDDQFDGGGNGGTLNISITPPPPPPTVSFTVDPTGTVDPSNGWATIGGTFTCVGEGVDFAGISGTMTERLKTKERNAKGFFFTDVPCDGTSTWTVTVKPDGAPFTAGNAVVNADAFACNFFACGEAHQTRIQVKLLFA